MSYPKCPYSNAGITVVRDAEPQPPDSLNIHGAKRVWIEKHRPWDGGKTRWVTIGFQDYESKYHKFYLSVFGDGEYPEVIEVEEDAGE